MIHINNLVCERFTFPLFRPISVVVNAGEGLKILGPNGSGKSTLLRTLAGFRTPVSGCVEIAKNVAFLGHHNNLQNDQTVTENLFWTTKIYRSKIGLDDVMKKFQLRALENTQVRELSAGQKRRASLANIYCMDRSVWILDEPTVGLDTSKKKWFDGFLKSELEGGRTIIFTTHDEHQVPRLKELRLGHCK